MRPLDRTRSPHGPPGLRPLATLGAPSLAYPSPVFVRNASTDVLPCPGGRVHEGPAEGDGAATLLNRLARGRPYRPGEQLVKSAALEPTLPATPLCQTSPPGKAGEQDARLEHSTADNIGLMPLPPDPACLFGELEVASAAAVALGVRLRAAAPALPLIAPTMDEPAVPPSLQTAAKACPCAGGASSSSWVEGRKLGPNVEQDLELQAAMGQGQSQMPAPGSSLGSGGPAPAQLLYLGPEPEVTLPLGLQQFPSVGSAGHLWGNCKPCAFATTKGCSSGAECRFCHLCEPGEKKRRQKEKRAFFGAMRRLQQQVADGWVPPEEPAQPGPE